MTGGQLALAFSTGMVAAFNPCGFAMLPAYLSYFLGLEDPETTASNRGAAILKAVGVSGALTLGFIVVFGLFGLVFGTVAGATGELLPYVTVVIGAGVVALGIAMLRGFEPTVRLPKLHMGAGSRQAASMFLFGVAYAVASLSCTVGIFLSNTINAASTGSALDSFVLFLAYGLGMGLVLTVLTLAVALAKQGLVHSMRRLLPYVTRISGILLLVAGVYVTYYGYWEIQINNNNLDAATPPLQSWQGAIQNWINDFGTGRLGIIFGALIAAAVTGAIIWRLLARRRAAARPGGTSSSGAGVATTSEDRSSGRLSTDGQAMTSRPPM